MNKNRKILLITFSALVLCICIVATFFFHPSMDYSSSSSKHFSSQQLSGLEQSLRWRHFISLSHTAHIRATYDEDTTQNLITISVLATQCKGEDSYCDTADPLYRAYKRYGKDRLASVVIVETRRDGSTQYSTEYYALTHGTWEFLFTDYS